MLMGLKSDNKIEAEAYFENADDIINEEEFEESIINQSIQKKAASPCKELPKTVNEASTTTTFVVRPLPAKPKPVIK